MIFHWWHVLVAAIPILPNLWSLWHLWSHDFNNDFERKVRWLLLCVFVPVIGGRIYIFKGRKYAGSKIDRRQRNNRFNPQG